MSQCKAERPYLGGTESCVNDGDCVHLRRRHRWYSETQATPEEAGRLLVAIANKGLADLETSLSLVTAQRDRAVEILRELAARPPDCGPECNCNASRARAFLATLESGT